MNPRDPIAKWAVPVNLDTGQPYTDAQLARIDKLKKAGKDLLAVMHESEGSDPENPQFTTRRMAIAATHIETALLFAMKAATES